MARILDPLSEWFSELGRRARVLLRAERFNNELDEEMQLHRELREKERRVSGCSHDDSRFEAQSQFGNSLGLRERGRDMWGWNWLEGLIQDVRFGLRVLIRNPGFTAVAILTLALGIGPNTAMFSVLNAVLLKPLPYPHPERLIVLRELSAQNDSLSVSFPDFEDWRAQQTVFEHMALYRRSAVSLTGSGDPERLGGAIASSDLFRILGFSPILGRVFSGEEDNPGSEPGVMLSYGLWQRRFGGAQDIVGKTLTLNSKAYTVIGVVPDSTGFMRDVEFWISFGPQAARPELSRRSNHMGYSALGQLKKGIEVGQARVELNAIASRLGKQFPDSNTGVGVVLTPMLDNLVGKYRTELLFLAGAVGLVLLIACANLANLLLAKGSARKQEIAMRAALGAPRGRIMRQLLTESAILALLGGALGIVLAMWARGTIIGLSPQDAARFQDTRLDTTVILFALGLSILTGLFYGTLPAWRLTRTNLRDVMQEGGRANSDGPGRQRTRQILIASEVSLTLVLLVSAGLMVQSLVRMQAVNLGFDSHNLLMTVVDLSPAHYDTESKVNAFYSEVLDRVRALPGVRGASLDSSAPLDTGWQTGFEVEGRPPFPHGKGPLAEISVIDVDYFRVMGIPILSGRSFGVQDGPEGRPAVIIDQAFAQRIWPGEAALGRRISLQINSPAPKTYTVVGIVPTVRLYGYIEEPRFLQLYFCQSQSAVPNPTLLVRSESEPLGLANSIRKIVYGLDPNQPVFAVRTLDQELSNSISSPRFMGSLFGVFAGLSLVLAMCGLYGVVAYGVSQRRREIGIRMALGARPSQVLWLVLRQGAQPAIAGIVLGLVSCFVVTRLLKSMLFGVSSLDPATFLAVSTLMAVVVFLACYIPARRALRVDPNTSLRYE